MEVNLIVIVITPDTARSQRPKQRGFVFLQILFSLSSEPFNHLQLPLPASKVDRPRIAVVGHVQRDALRVEPFPELQMPLRILQEIVIRRYGDCKRLQEVAADSWRVPAL